MIFRGLESKRAKKQTMRQVYALVPGVPQYLDWSDFDRSDHPDFIPNPGKSALVLDLIIGGFQLTKVLIDGGSGTNIIYADTMKKIVSNCPHIAK